MVCTPPPVPTDELALDLEADAGLGLANNDPVALWEDQSAAGNNAAQATGANQPTFKSADGPGGTHPCVDFDGTTDFMDFPNITSQKWTVFAVLKPSAAVTQEIICGEAGSFEYRVSNSLKQLQNKCNASGGVSSTTTLSTVSFQQINLAYDGINAMFRFNGAADGFQSNPRSFTVPINGLGYNPESGLVFFGGSICMVKVYTAVLALDQIQAVEAEILARWGV